MTPKELKDNEKKILAWIEKAGAISPSQLAAETMILPQEMWEMLNRLAERDLVMLRDDPDSVDGKLIFAAPMAKAASKIQAKPEQDEP